MDTQVVDGRRPDKIEPVKVEAIRRGGDYRQGVLERAEVELAITTAKRYPRNISTFQNECETLATLDTEIAEDCFYAVPRSGGVVEGPSVRMAEIALSAYGNAIAEADVLGEDDRFIYAMGMARDLERNVTVRIRVRRRITDKNGRRFNDDMIAVTANAACAIALRNAIFKIIPSAFLKKVYDKIRKVAVGDAQSLVNKRAEVMLRLQKLGIEPARVLAVLNRKGVEDINRDDVLRLIALGTAVKDGDASLDTAFPPVVKPKPAEAPQPSQAGVRTEMIPEYPPSPVQPAQAKPAAKRGIPAKAQDEPAKQEDWDKQMQGLNAPAGPVMESPVIEPEPEPDNTFRPVEHDDGSMEWS